MVLEMFILFWWRCARKEHTVDLVIFARFYSSRISRGRQIREFKNSAKIIIIIALLKKTTNSRILSFVKSPDIINSRKFNHAKITGPTVSTKID